MIKKILIVLYALVLWFLPAPEEVSQAAWQLFVIFSATILGVVFGAFHILVASILGMVIAIFTRTLEALVAFSGFSNDIVLLILMAFLVAKAVVKSGLGRRIALLLISRFGRTSLGLGYSLLATDLIIAPAFPSNTARSGLLFPIVYSVSLANGSNPAVGTEARLGRFLMFTSMFGLGLSSGMYLTAMAANPAGAEIAASYGVEISFASWMLAALVPTLLAAALLPLLLYRIYPPEVKNTPDAPVFARESLREMGKMQRDEIITAVVFVFLVLGWALSGNLNLDRTAIAFLGFGLLLLTNVYPVKDIRNEGEALGTIIWFAILLTMSSALNDMGFMDYVGGLLAGYIEGFPKALAYTILVLAYILLHYLFVSQTAHLLALFGVFLGAGIHLGIDPLLLAFMLLFANNYFSVITPQGSSCNILYLSSGYIRQQDIYKYGGIMTLACFVLYMMIGSGWIGIVF